MAKLSIIFPLSSLFVISLLLPLAYSEREVTNIHFYLQNQFNRNISYGDVYAYQDPLTVDPDPNSTLLGRAQGTVAFTAPDGSFDIHMSVAYIFTSGRYSGSTVVAVGRTDVTQNNRQFAIVGGTGALRLARGIATMSTYSTSPRVEVIDLEIIQDFDNTNIEMAYV